MAAKTTGEGYLLSRDYIDCTRLNLQHHLWTQMFGYLLHPNILPNTPPEILKIADIGTGTGVWLTDLASQLPDSTQLDGFDVDTSQAPPKEWLPANVVIRQWDIFTEVPDELIEQYDVVNVRLLVFVLREDPLPVLRRLIKLLKPGWWLQWAEPDVPSMRITKTNSLNTETALHRLFTLTAAQDPRLVPHWPSQLPTLLADQGMKQVYAHHVNAKPRKLDSPVFGTSLLLTMMRYQDQEFAMHECNLLIYDMIAHSGAGIGDQANEISRLVPEAARESKGGVMFAFPRLTVIGRKA
ncbi:hypothetical protein BCON_0043g00120 [Botryotinia convoluta]|uniref:Methyltransferase domain-containing protein n=1 Tax=Botryotinia convoluta TaxID=54673 RepID=A0A4Z1IGA9_9HELO|nr:hypothetical protein BCON_0043g00120 [Botryotinia convoluta]